MPLTRATDWAERLQQAIDAARDCTFEWGRHDCALWAADVVFAQTGVDYAARFRGRYRSAAGAQRQICKYGGLAVIVTRALGEPVPALQARRGDVVIMSTDQGLSLGIAVDHNAAFVSMQGLAFYPLDQCVQAWHV